MKLVPIDPLRPWMGLKPDLPPPDGDAPTWLQIVFLVFFLSLVAGYILY